MVLSWCGKFPHLGVVLQTIFPDGVVLKHFPDGGSFVRVLHACSTQTARTTGEFGLYEQIAISTGDICMHREPPV